MSNITLRQALERSAVPLRNHEDWRPLAEAASAAAFTLLGEASHGTSEFYSGRTALTRLMIEEHGCRYVVVEGDWPSCMALNRYVKQSSGAPPTAREAMRAFERWPAWMWANEEIVELADWIRSFNERLPEGEAKVGFYGFDVYSLWESLEEIIAHLKKIGSPALERAKQAMACFEAHQRDEQSYAVSSAFYDEDCEDDVVQLLARVRREKQAGMLAGKGGGDGSDASLAAEVNALVAVHAEQYYRTMVSGDAQSWNVRDRHMVEVLGLIADAYGTAAKGVVWAHNTHIGDARATDMAREGMVNVGQLMRERYGEYAVFAIGFGTYRGTVAAGSSWGAPLSVMDVPPGMPGSWEALLHETGAFDKYVVFRGTSDSLGVELPHRAIGVVYDPHRERLGNYVPSVIGERYDAFVYYEKSSAIRPLDVPSLQSAATAGT